MSGLPWFRVYNEILTDRKIKRICKTTRQSKALVIGVWVCLLAIAGESSQRGTLVISNDVPYTLEDLEEELDLPREIIAQIVDEFKRFDMISGNTTLTIVNWQKRQYREDSAARVRKHRAKLANVTENVTVDVTACNAIDTDTDTEQNRADVDATTPDFSPVWGEWESTFIEATKLPLFSGGPDKWFSSFEIMKKAGATPSHMRRAINTLLQKKYTIAGPSSLINTTIGMVAQDSVPTPKRKTRILTFPDGSTQEVEG